MTFKNRRTPGVYITELNAFPPSIVGVQTAVPAFIGYTEKAEIDRKPVYKKAVKIGSLADFELIFGKGFKPKYTLTEVPATDTAKITNGEYDFKVLDPNVQGGGEKYYNLVQSNANKFYLYNSMRYFYANGGGNCYVVSVGNYTDSGTTLGGVDVSYAKLKEGLDVIGEQVGPTMLVVPDAVLLPPADPNKDPYKSTAFKDLIKDMLKQCATLQDRVSVLDVYGSQYVTNQTSLDAVMAEFRDKLTENLNYGMAYFPFLRSTVISAADFDYTNLETAADLETILGWVSTNLYSNNTARKTQVDADIKLISDVAIRASEDQKRQLNQNLVAALPLLGDMLRIIAKKEDVLPPSGAMAGIYTRIDATRGVWNAPANTSVDSTDLPTYKLNNVQQGDLNVPVDGKAINAIREFPGRGTVVWGARTLDGNSNDWRYIQVRRTLIYIEQSIKSAVDRFVFAANDGSTWVAVTSMVSNFLQGLWSQGGLMGATAQEAFSVECGLGSTMTAQDILDGYMIVQVTLQMIRPAEFIELTFKQKMEGA